MTTERQVTDELAHLIAEAEGVTPETEVSQGDIISKDSELGPMAVGSLKEAGWTYVYDIRTGDRSLVNNNMLSAQLQKKDPETGMRVFTTRDPGYRPTVGAMKCWLHEEGPKAHLAKEFGFAHCKKSNMSSEFTVREHVRKRHPQEFRAIDDQEERSLQAEDRRIQRELLERAMGQVPAAPVLAPEPVVEAEQEPEMMTKTCKTCGEAVTAEKNKIGVTMAQHARASHS